MTIHVLVPLPMFKELFKNVSVQKDCVTGTLKTKKNDAKLIACKLYNDKTGNKKSAKARLVCLHATQFVYLPFSKSNSVGKSGKRKATTTQAEPKEKKKYTKKSQPQSDEESSDSSAASPAPANAANEPDQRDSDSGYGSDSSFSDGFD